MDGMGGKDGRWHEENVMAQWKDGMKGSDGRTVQRVKRARQVCISLPLVVISSSCKHCPLTAPRTRLLIYSIR
jgi:hypothetical protein